MTKKLNVVFFGTPDIGLKSLEHLYKSENFNIQAVVTQPDRPSGRGHKLTPSPIKLFALENNIPVFPGVCTPTEIMMVMEYNLPVVKFFPASQYGGLDTIKALSGPFPSLRFMPTGGVNAGNVKEYLANPKIIACGGSWMVKENLIKEGKFDEITRLTAEAMALVRE